MYVRVKDRDTGHEFDVLEGDPRIGEAMQLVKKASYPPAYQTRPAKHNIGPARGTKPKPTQGSGHSKPQPSAKKAAERADTP